MTDGTIVRQVVADFIHFVDSFLGLLPTEWVDLSEKLSERLAKEEVGGFSPGRKVAQIS